MGNPTWSDVLFATLLLLFFGSMWLVAYRSHGPSSFTHVLAVIVVLLVVLTIGIMPFDWLATVNALLARRI